MEIKIAGKNMDLGSSLQDRISSGLEAAVSKYFERTGDAHVFVSKHGAFTEVDCNVHLPSGITLQSTGKGTETYAALEEALEKMEKRVRRYHRRLKDHHRNNKHPFPAEMAMSSVLQSVEETDDSTSEDGAPLTIAETDAKIQTMSVADAVMQMELSESPAIMFRNASHEGLNMVYRRPDGNIGWVNPKSDA